MKAAPRRACALVASGMASSWARERWNPSIGMKAAMGLLFAVPGDRSACFLFSRLDTTAARVVLPGREVSLRKGDSRFIFDVVYQNQEFQIRR